MRAAAWWPKRLDYNQLLLVWVKKTIIWIEYPTTQVFTRLITDVRETTNV